MVTPDASRFACWFASWRAAIRIARRDARRYKWRSALIVAMVGIPVLLLTGGISLMATKHVSAAESVPMVMGSAQARVRVGGTGVQHQWPDTQSAAASDIGRKALAVPGFAPDSAWTSDKVRTLVGGRVIRRLDAMMRVTLGDRRPSVAVLGIEARDPLARGMTELVSGRWAGTTSEIVVTEAGVASGLPREGRLVTTGLDGTPRLLTVVGVAVAQTENEVPLLVAPPDLVTDVAEQEGVALSFLVGRPDPVTWSDVRLMNGYGLLVQSRKVFLTPPPDTELDLQVVRNVSSYQGQLDLILLLAAVCLIIETTLLAGPAFAVSAARQRRSLALAAANGAQARQLRRYVLGQAVLLGVASAAIAVVAGVLLTLAGLTCWQLAHPELASRPFEVPWPRVMGVFICAVVASVVAALLPARGVGRLDIVSVLAGRSGDGAVRRGLPAVGGGVMVLSAIAIIWSVSSGGEEGLGLSEYSVVGGSVGLVLGCLMVIPALLALVGRLGTHLVLPLRLAARDTARQRGRSTPVVAAIMAAVAALTALSIGAASDTRQQEDAYKPRMPMGTGAIELTSEDSTERSLRAVTDRFAPQVEVDVKGYVADTGATGTMSQRVAWVSLVPTGCSEAQIVAFLERHDGAGGCATLTNQSSIDVGGLPSLEKALHLSTSQRDALQAGGILITDPRLVHDGQVISVGGTKPQRSDGSTGYAITTRTSVPAVLMDPRIWEAAFPGQGSGAWVLPGTATKLGWPVRIEKVNLSSPTGTIAPDVERAMADRLGDGYLVYVERGFQSQYWLILLVGFSVAGLLVLIAALISTALSLAESQNDMATLAAVGATRRTRRGIAACQALVVAACGTLLGLVVGMVPGIAVTWPLTARVVDGVTGEMTTRSPIIVIPWLQLVAVCVGVPLLAAALAWMAVRRHPQMTRRLA